MDSANTKLLAEQSSSRKQRKITFIISLIILFTIIISSIVSVLLILKHKAESESLLALATPAEAIRAVCSLIHAPPSCSTSILWGFQSINYNTSNSPSNNISPSQIFALSLLVTYKELANLNSDFHKVIPKAKVSSRNIVSLRRCQNLTRDSLRLINQSMISVGISPKDEIFKDLERVGNLKNWIKTADENLKECLDELKLDQERLIFGTNFYLARMKRGVLVSRQYVITSSMILEEKDVILDMFYNPIHIHTVLFNIMLSTSGFDFSLVFFPSQYLVLLFLLCLFFRLY
ncbi:OLC1v1012622C1 [Oldenlandia corymbosa var. corymbosa]|uniref:OLC1v1012622C1 n=1 Tax=Oldenlandia corymbosa var. corymbosa TaxID=529605 RepID=A0AAV1DYT6_OLDCO|nr:OLC1v1012622C1 [Oldenlandia corymbosa var. corymbosa]